MYHPHASLHDGSSCAWRPSNGVQCLPGRGSHVRVAGWWGGQVLGRKQFWTTWLRCVLQLHVTSNPTRSIRCPGTCRFSSSVVQGSPVFTLQAVLAGGYSTCAIVESMEGLLCWGANGFGQLGLGNTRDSPGPPPSPIISAVSAVAVSRGWNGFTCALLSSGSLRCWGDDDAGQLGLGEIQ